MQTDSGLDTGFFVSRNHKIIVCQSLAFPKSLIETQNSLGFGLKVGITGKEPRAMLRRTNGILIEPSPNGSLTDFGDQTTPGDLADQILAAVTGERLTAFFGQFAGHGLDLHHQFRGKNWAGAQTGEGSPNLPGDLQRNACATC